MAPGNKKAKGKAPVATPAGAILRDNIPDPIATLDLSDIEKLPQRYKDCVDEVIRAMKADSGPNFTFLGTDGKECKCVPATPGLDNSASGVYTIALTDGNKRPILVATKYQNWLRGIVTDGGDRYELDGLEPKIMTGSRSLNNTRSYLDLLGATVNECIIGYHPLMQSFYNMAKHNDENKDSGVSIAVLLVMLFEAPRFPEVFQKCMELFEEMREGEVGEALKKLINNWGTTSERFFIANGDQMSIQLTEQTCEAIKEVASRVSILCGSEWDVWLRENKP